jgi:hypothetical protein
MQLCLRDETHLGPLSVSLRSISLTLRRRRQCGTRGYLRSGLPEFYVEDEGVDIMEAPDGRKFQIRFVPHAMDAPPLPLRGKSSGGFAGISTAARVSRSKRRSRAGTHLKTMEPAKLPRPADLRLPGPSEP